MSDPWLQNESRKETDARFEQDLVNGIAREFLAERRRARRWGIVFKLFGAGVVTILLVIFLSDGADISGARLDGAEHTALIDIQGVIANSEPAGADHVTASLRAAYEDGKTAGIILRINSPGGSPVQAGYVNDEINRLKSEHPDIPVYAVIGDLCASGGYYIAVAADQIYADKASLVGSIGVVMGGFGFVDTLNKLGMERRVYHAGANKAFLDPFQPAQDEEVSHVNTLLDNVYQQFVETVKQGRGDRLSADERIFSGLIWTGEQSLALGLIDGLGNADYVARELIGAEDIVDFTYRDTLLEQFSKELGALFRNSVRIF
ncbi:MAG: S49 family peptidase [Gammaproteobacteria bacterium]|nr:S49 family peptidase [Gammaproteobacteria bacterium]MCY4282197.1 S49 family peptidase [Gammaproteobacteria bacterium]MCY4337624.1 S49 family peptidase [Gammaproteobacteria bacterium]